MAQTIDEPAPGARTAGDAAAEAPPVAAPEAPTAPQQPVTTPEGIGQRARSRERKSPARRTRVTVRRVGPLSVLKLSLIFYFCVMLAIFLGLLFLFMIMQAVGVVDSIEESITNFLGDSGTFQINPGWIFPRLFAIGVGMVVVWSFINLIVAFLYNLISDVVGGVEITLAEKK